jgi:lipopolysaccharide transport system permease protein
MFIAGMVFIWAPLFRMSMSSYLPFLASGLVSWALISSLVTEGCTTYAYGGNIITQINFPYSTLNYVAVWRNIIVFFHNFLLIVFIDTLLATRIGLEHVLLLPIGLLIVAANGAWITVVLGLIGARFRDIPPLVANLMQVMMFVTPVFWNLSQFPASAQGYLKLNYFLHLLQILRAPMMGETPELISYVVTILGAAIGWLFAFVLFAHFRRRVAYWL